MKANYYRPSTGQRTTKVKITFTIDTDDIEVAVMLLLDGEDYTTIKLTRRQVEKKLKAALYERGRNYFEWSGDRDKWMDGNNLELLQSEAEDWAKRLFPDFYKKVETGK